MTLLDAGAWIVAQVGAQLATLPDTIVTKQAPIQPGWFERTSEILRALMTLAILVLTVAVVPAALNFRKSYAKISDLLDRIYADVNPITHHASRIAENIDYVTTALRADVQRASATLTDANTRLQEAIRHAESRARDFDALLAVVQDETEGAFVSTAATARGMRTGLETLRDALQLTLRDARRAALATSPQRRSRKARRARELAMDAHEAHEADEADDVANELGAVDVRRTPFAGSPAVIDETVDDQGDDPMLDDDIVDTDFTAQEDAYDADHQQRSTPRDQRPRVRPRRHDDA